MRHVSFTGAASPDSAGARAPSAVLSAHSPDLLRWFFIPLLVLTFFLVSLGNADAKRFGGGKSFGGKEGYSKSYDKPTPPDRNAASAQKKSDPGAQAAQGGFMSRFGGMGGMLGGLLIGGMLGSLFFGGAGGGLGILEILLIGIGVFFLFRFLRSRRRTQENQAPQTLSDAPGGERYAYASAPAGDGWASLRQPGGDWRERASSTQPVDLPAGIDEAEFLAGAKTLYNRLQGAWDRRDLEDIRRFVSPAVLAEISRQASEDPTPSKTDILTVEAKVLDTSQTGAQIVVSVLFDVLLRENQAESRSTLIQEVWRLCRDESIPQAEWILDGIQQIDHERIAN